MSVARLSRLALSSISALSSGYPFRKKLAEENYSFNNSLAEGVTGLIQGQRNEPVAAMKFGLARLADVGCEIIAVHNAYCLLGKTENFAKTILDFEQSGLMMGFGFLGSNPFRIEGYLRRHRASFVECDSLWELSRRLCENDVFILSFWNKKYGLHTVCAQKTQRGIYVYNAKGRALEPCLYKTVGQAFCKSYRFLTSYIIKKI